jgi:hypothetical protein
MAVAMVGGCAAEWKDFSTGEIGAETAAESVDNCRRCVDGFEAGVGSERVSDKSVLAI